MVTVCINFIGNVTLRMDCVLARASRSAKSRRGMVQEARGGSSSGAGPGGSE